MKDAITYANDAGFFSFNVIGWKAEFERLIDAVRADVLEEMKEKDLFRGVTKKVESPKLHRAGSFGE